MLGRAIENIRAKAAEICGAGETYVLPLLVAHGHLSEEIPEILNGTTCSFIDFSFAGSEHIDEYFHSCVEEPLTRSPN